MNLQISEPFRKNEVDYTIIYCESLTHMNMLTHRDNLDRQELEKKHGDNLIFCIIDEHIRVECAKDGAPPVTQEDILNVDFPSLN